MAMAAAVRMTQCPKAQKVLLATVISGLAFLYFTQFVPVNSWECIAYHGLSHPARRSANLFPNVFIDGDYLAPFAGIHLPLRSYGYIGIVPGILFFPILKLWPAPPALRVAGIILLLFQSWLIQRTFRIDMRVALLVLLFMMPYAFQNIVDTGPVAFQLASVFLIYHLAGQWMSGLENYSRRSAGFPLAIGVCMFLGIWSKLSYFFMLPAVLALIAYEVATNIRKILACGRMKALALHSLLLSASAAVPSFMLLNSRQTDGVKYYELILRSETISVLDLKAWCGQAKLILAYFSNPYYAAQEVFVTKGALRLEGIGLVAIIAAIILLGTFKLRRRKEPVSFILLNLSLFFVTLFLLTLSRRTWAMHHVVLSFPFLLMAVFQVFARLSSDKGIVLLLIALLAVNAGLYARLPMLPVYDFAHPAATKINRMLNERYSENYVFIFLCEELYHCQVLFKGREQRVLYPGAYWESSRIGEMKDVLSRLGRKVLFITRRGNDMALRMIRTEFPICRELKMDFDPGLWSIWREE